MSFLCLFVRSLALSLVGNGEHISIAASFTRLFPPFVYSFALFIHSIIYSFLSLLLQVHLYNLRHGIYARSWRTTYIKKKKNSSEHTHTEHKNWLKEFDREMNSFYNFKLCLCTVYGMRQKKTPPPLAYCYVVGINILRGYWRIHSHSFAAFTLRWHCVCCCLLSRYPAPRTHTHSHRLEAVPVRHALIYGMPENKSLASAW